MKEAHVPTFGMWIQAHWLSAQQVDSEVFRAVLLYLTVVL